MAPSQVKALVVSDADCRSGSHRCKNASHTKTFRMEELTMRVSGQAGICKKPPSAEEEISILSVTMHCFRSGPDQATRR
jgi:hypothetical protein